MAPKNTKKGTSFQKRLKKLDKFGIPVRLNFDGSESIKTLPGAIVTLII